MGLGGVGGGGNGAPEWRSLWATLRNTVEGANGYLKDPNWSNIEEAGRRRLRGFAGQAFLLACQLLGSNIRKLETFMTQRTTSTPEGPKGQARTRRHRTTPDVAHYRPESTDQPLARPA